MIKLFGVSETSANLSTLNGDHILKPSKAVVHKYENGDYYLELETILDDSSWFGENMIIVVDDLPYASGFRSEYFRIKSIVRERGKTKLTCPQIFDDMKWSVEPFDAAANAVQVNTWYGLLSYMNGIDSGFVSGNGSFTVTDHTVSGQTDFPTMMASDSLWEGMTFWEVLQGYMKKFGGYLYRDRRTFGIARNRITRDNGFTIRYGNNLKSISKTEDWSEVCTYLVAVGSTGFCKSYTNSTQYTYKYNKIVKFQQDIDQSSYASKAAYDAAVEADLDAKAAAYFAEHTLPTINYTLDAYVERGETGWNVSDIGDIINVIDEKLGVNVITTVLGFDFDVVGQKFNKIEFGNYANSMKGYNSKINERLGLLETNVTGITYPVGAVIQNTGGNPATKGINGYWTQVSSSGGISTWQRVS